MKKLYADYIDGKYAELILADDDMVTVKYDGMVNIS